MFLSYATKITITYQYQLYCVLLFYFYVLLVFKYNNNKMSLNVHSSKEIGQNWKGCYCTFGFIALKKKHSRIKKKF